MTVNAFDSVIIVKEKKWKQNTETFIPDYAIIEIDEK